MEDIDVHCALFFAFKATGAVTGCENVSAFVLQEGQNVMTVPD